MPLKKTFMKSKNMCRVTFNLPANDAKTAFLVGDFNEWNVSATPMKKSKQGFSTTLELESGKEYQFRYFLNGEKWANDDQADGYIKTTYPDTENCIVNVST